ncbi:hypothetical protein RvY_18288 [Ramazzottius varieornatus]|uniref:Tudor-knot domain-containing protein n=1 Tax=Ramazzottius varieornatus TaxID=947166 RepID=A0A1D1W6W4_RAMVA|nr:hypothetical protein RvY_18288 [Ramazzottius varieornatus]
MDKASTSSAASNGGIPPPIMTINPAPSTPNRNTKKRELDDDTEMRLEDFTKKFNIGDDVWVISKGQWHKAKIILIETDKYPGDQSTSVPIYRIHYPGWGKRYDEWMFSDSLMLQNTENDAKALAENDAFMEASGIKNKKTGKKTAQKDKTTSSQMTERKSSVPQSPNPMTFDGVSSARGRGRGGSRGGATAKPRGATSSKRARSDAGPSAEDRISTGNSQSLEPSSLASALESESSTVTDKPYNGKGHSSVSAGSITGSLADGGMKEESAEPGRVLTEEQKKEKVVRAQEEFDALVEHYEECDVGNPEKESADEQLMILDILSAVGVAPEADMEPRSAVEKQKQCLEALHKLSYLTVARMRKLLDQTIFKVSLPQGVKRLMADNYIQTVRNAKILKAAEPAYSAKTVLEKYRAHSQTVPEGKSIFWNKARLAEINSLESILSGSFSGPNLLAQRFMMRLEWPMLTEWKKGQNKGDKADALQRLGVIHVVRLVQLMTYFYNSESKKLVGNPSKQLLAIYDDLLKFIEETFVPPLLENTDALYQHMDEAYLEKVKYVGFEKVDDTDDPGVQDTMHPFHHLSDSFFDELADRHINSDMKDLTLVVEWKAVTQPETEESSASVKDQDAMEPSTPQLA